MSIATFAVATLRRKKHCKKIKPFYHINCSEITFQGSAEE
jgi:hypothetical protein